MKPLALPKAITVSVDGPDRQAVADLLIDAAIGYERQAAGKRKGSQMAIVWQSKASRLRKLANAILG